MSFNLKLEYTVSFLAQNRSRTQKRVLKNHRIDPILLILSSPLKVFYIREITRDESTKGGREITKGEKGVRKENFPDHLPVGRDATGHDNKTGYNVSGHM